MMTHEARDRRAFLRGLMLTSAGLLVPRVVYSIAAPRKRIVYRGDEVTLSFGGGKELASMVDFDPGHFTVDLVRDAVKKLEANGVPGPYHAHLPSDFRPQQSPFPDGWNGTIGKYSGDVKFYR